MWGRRAGTVGGGRRAGEVLLCAGTVVERRQPGVSVAGATRVLGRCSSARETARETRYATRREDVMIDRGERREGAERVAFLPVVVLGSRRFQPAVLGAMLQSLGAADERACDGARAACPNSSTSTQNTTRKNKQIKWWYS